VTLWHDAAVSDLIGDPWRLAISPVELVLRSLAVPEQDGSISMVQRGGPDVRIRRTARPYRTRGPSR
jgi:hypothetical protein